MRKVKSGDKRTHLQHSQNNCMDTLDRMWHFTGICSPPGTQEHDSHNHNFLSVLCASVASALFPTLYLERPDVSLILIWLILSF